MTVQGTVVGTNLCVPRPLEIKGKGIRGVGGVADKEAYSVRTIVSQRQFFVPRCLISFVGSVFGLRCICVCFPSARKLAT
jgi:hypothetical protein